MMKMVIMMMIHLIMADRSGWDAFALSGLVRLQAFDGADWTYEAVGDDDHWQWSLIMWMVMSFDGGGEDAQLV